MKRWLQTKPWNNRLAVLKIKHKMFLLISLVMGVCFLIAYGMLQYAYSIYDGQLYSKSSQLLTLSASGIENELSKVERLSFTIATDSQLQSLLQSLNEDTPEFERYRIRALLADKLVQYTGYEKYLSSVEIIDPLDVPTRAGQTGQTPAERVRELQDEARQGAGAMRWIYPAGGDQYLVATRLIRSYENISLAEIGTLVIRVKLKEIVDDVAAGTELNKGELQIYSGARLLYPPADGTSPAIVERLPKPGYLIKRMNGTTYFFTQIQSGEMNWTYYSLIPFGHIFEQITLMKRLLLFGFFGSLLIVMAIAFRFARGITKPIEELIARMKLVKNGDFREAQLGAADSWPMPMDEVGQLQRTFRMMVAQIDELITENYAKQLTIKETQFRALQAQINPHFLYNTLESINWLAKVKGEKQISRMVESLGFLLRSSISLKRELITVEEELEIVAHYLTIQKYRFEERLAFEVDVPECARSCLLPKFTLQPLLENALHYAVEPSIDPVAIRIYAEEREGKLALTVSDRGPGMDPEQLALVRSGEARTRGSGIGLRNIAERIQLAFGEAYGLQIDSERHVGTTVSLIIPKEAGDKHV
ncbi:sensor histidine kinase [Paenibacillus cymbidii]|uniref:sensor histidine kinase n=1 Tax=Paenibacillus cymbidii TaxID=1639034 RepID=UPI0010800E53|nr:sensor histidine kinase [Paenibacillus cymbidii]